MDKDLWKFAAAEIGCWIAVIGLTFLVIGAAVGGVVAWLLFK